MFESLTIQNFQSHTKTKIRFDEAITTIVGSSDKGKSAILRALRWVCLNQPAGDSFRKRGTSITKVILRVDGHKIVRIRGSRKNQYIIDGKVLEAFRATPPDEVLQILKVSSHNFQRQHESPFWFSLTPGEVSRQLNSIVDLSIIDTTIKKIVQRVHKASSEEKVYMKEEAEAKRILGEMSFFPEMQKQYNKLEGMRTAINKHTQKKCSLQKHLSSLEKYIPLLTYNMSFVEEYCILDRAQKALREIEDRREGLSNLVDKFTHMQSTSSQTIPNIQSLLEMEKEWKGAERMTLVLSRVVASLREELSSICRQEEILQQTKQRYQKELGRTCPLCGNKIKS